VADNYHVINCEIGGEPVVYTTCERCQFGSVLVSILDGKPVKICSTSPMPSRTSQGQARPVRSDWIGTVVAQLTVPKKNVS
jgi:hypothetical protein